MKKKSALSPASLLAATAIAMSGGAFTASASSDVVNVTPSDRIIQGGKQVPNRAMPSFQEMQAMRGMFQGAIRSHRYPRPGYSVKQGQRMARKVSNKARNRRAHR